MQICSYPMTTPDARPCIIALGFFDGVHLAHRRLLQAARAMADARGVPLCVFTFPSESPQIKQASRRIYPTEIKLSLLSACGVQRVILCPFEAVCDMTAETFVRQVLCRDLGCIGAVCGYNFRFAKGAYADAQALHTLLAAQGCDCHIEPPFCHAGDVLSATRIRAHLCAGAMEQAAELLGEPYRLCGTCEHGLGLGRRLGTPTVNLPLPHGVCIPPHGVYRCIACVDGICYHALTNIGTCPTFGEREAHAECFLLDFNGDLYGKTVTVYLLARLRDERAFSSAEELKMQILIDKNNTLEQNPSLDEWHPTHGRLQWQENGQS